MCLPMLPTKTNEKLYPKILGNFQIEKPAPGAQGKKFYKKSFFVKIVRFFEETW